MQSIPVTPEQIKKIHTEISKLVSANKAKLAISEGNSVWTIDDIDYGMKGQLVFSDGSVKSNLLENRHTIYTRSIAEAEFDARLGRWLTIQTPDVPPATQPEAVEQIVGIEHLPVVAG